MRAADDDEHRPATRRFGRLMAVFGAMLALQVVVALLSFHVLSAVRAYSSGESLYAKAQKDALLHLGRWVQDGQDVDWRSFESALAVNLGDRRAREALQRPRPDLAEARAGFLQGGNHPDDIEGLVQLFLWGHEVRFMADAIALWTEADRVIADLRARADRARAARQAAGDGAAELLAELRQRLPPFNEHLTLLENQFSARLGEAARTTQWLLVGLNLAVAALLLAGGARFVRARLHERAVTEAELVARKQALRRVLDSTAEGIYGFDTAGRCTFINRAALQMLGFEEDSGLLGEPIHALVHRAPTDGPHCGEPGCWMCDTQRLLAGGVLGGRTRLRRRDGSSFPVECWAHPVHEQGRMEGAVVTFFDITERLHMQAALREGELRIHELVDSVSEGVVAVDREARVVLFNRAAEQLFGCPAARALGQPLEAFVPALDLGGRRHLRGKVQEVAGRCAEGRSVPLEASVSQLDTDRGRLTTVVLRDMTEVHAARAERQTRAALEAANRAKTEFLSRMSHELRTPLNAVKGFSELLLADHRHPLAPQQAVKVRHIAHAGAHLLALVNDVLDLARVEARQVPLALETVDLGVVVDESIALLLPQARAHGVKIRGSACADGPVRVRADRVRLKQVVVNLISNAVKYNRRGGLVEVDWRCGTEGCELHIRDSGCGMTPDQVQQLFQPFNRLGAERSRVEGTGIGLVLSRDLLALMGGRLEIASEAGRGTQVALWLPLASGEPLPAAVRPPPAPAGRPAPHVVYAEDNEVNVLLLREMLALMRPEVRLRVADCGTQALQMVQQEPPDLVFVDMNLGDMTGLELAQALRRHPRTAAVRLVALSADAMPDQVARALAAGFEDYLTKPLRAEALLKAVDSVPPAPLPAAPRQFDHQLAG